MKRLAILSSPILVGEHHQLARLTSISLAKAKALIAWPHMEVRVYTSHATVRLFGLEPDTTRAQCPGYDAALVVVPNERLEFGREYSVEEIEKIGYSIKLIEIL